MKKRRIIVSGVIGVLIVIGVVITVLSVKNKKPDTAKPKSDNTKPQEVISIADPDEDTNTEELLDSAIVIKPDESKADKILEDKKKSAEKTADLTVPEAPTVKEKKYVQDANPETGISWDGVSKITYRTSNGETTQKTYGGYYEIRPDEWVLLEYPTEKETYNNKCPVCGRVSGDGRNGTCVRYSLIDSDMTCENCGETIPAKTCHTCKLN